MTFPTLLLPSYWFQIYPLPLLPVVAKVLLIMMLALLCAGIAVLIYGSYAKGFHRPKRNAIRTLGSVLLWAGIVGLYLYAMTVTVVSVLGMRIWFVVWFALFAWLGFVSVRRLVKEVPAGLANEEAKSSYEKWLPKPKK